MVDRSSIVRLLAEIMRVEEFNSAKQKRYGSLFTHFFSRNPGRTPMPAGVQARLGKNLHPFGNDERVEFRTFRRGLPSFDELQGSSLGTCRAQMLGEKIADRRAIAERQVVADVITAFEQEPLFHSGSFVVDPLGLLDGDEIVCSMNDQKRAADFRCQPLQRTAAVQLDELLLLIDFPDVRHACEFEGIIEAIEHAGAVVHAAGKRAGFDARIAGGGAGCEIAAHARAEDADAAGVDLGQSFEIIDDRRSRPLELDDQTALKPTFALPRPVESEGRHAAAQKTVFHSARFFLGRFKPGDDNNYWRFVDAGW